MILLGLSLLAALGGADSTLKPEERTLIAALREDIPQILRLVGTPGLNLAIARRGEVIYEDGFGIYVLHKTS